MHGAPSLSGFRRVKPAPFRYFAPATLEEATRLLAQYGDEAKLIAGGQSLGPMLNLRLAAPAVLVDLNSVQDLAQGAWHDEAGFALGAMTRQRDAERDAAVASMCPLLEEALHDVAHPAIRNRGTIGGSIAHADPAAEIPTVVAALNARITATSVRGVRELAASDFFTGYFSTHLEADEILVQITIPRRSARTGFAWREFATRHGDFAVVGVAAAVTLGEDDQIAEATLAYAGVASTPQVAGSVLDALSGPRPEERVDHAADLATSLIDPPDDLIASAGYRRTLARTLTRRALAASIARARGIDGRG